jgi:hypothetical protein
MPQRFIANTSPSVLSRTTNFTVEDSAYEATPLRDSVPSSSLQSTSMITRMALFGRVGVASLWAVFLFCLCGVALGRWSGMIDFDPTLALNVFALLSGATALVFEICRSLP